MFEQLNLFIGALLVSVGGAFFTGKEVNEHEKLILLMDGIPDTRRDMDVYFTIRIWFC